jgi:hypothetical protein
VELTRIERMYVDIQVTATLAGGGPATIAGVDVALVQPRTTPTSTTTWAPASYTTGTATVLLAGPDAAGSGALVVPADGADLWIRVSDTPEIDTARVGRVSII